MKKFLAALFAIALAANASAQNTHLEGSLLNHKGAEEIRILHAYTQELITTTRFSENNRFSIDLQLEKPEYIYIGTTEANVILLILSPNEKVQLTADLDDPSHPMVQGSVLTTKLYQMMDKADSYTTKKDSIKRKADSLTYAIELERSRYFHHLFSTEEPTLASLVFLDLLDPVKDSAIFRNVVEKLNQQFPENEFVKDYMSEMNGPLPVLIEGATPPDIRLPDPDGKPITLSSLKGKVVLVDFWASWCKPCITEIPNLKELYKKYHKKGFEIYSISLDRDRSSWVDAIDKYDLSWLHVSDLKLWECKAAIDWQVDAVPFTVLIDREGRVIQTGLRGEELSKMLDSLFE